MTSMHSNTSLSNYAQKIYLSLYLITPTSYRPSMILPALDHAAHHSQQWVTPELGLNSTEQGIPRLGRDNMKLHSTTRRISSKELLTPIDHKLSFPTCLSHLMSIHLHCPKIHRLLQLLFRGFNNRSDQKLSEISSCY
jgi:hypothetical protein